MCVLVITLAICCRRGCFGRRSKYAQKSDCENPIYEDIPEVLLGRVEMKMDPNVCYSMGKCVRPQLLDPQYAEIESIKSNNAYSVAHKVNLQVE